MKQKSHMMGLRADAFRQIQNMGLMGSAAMAVCAVGESPHGLIADFFSGIQSFLAGFCLLSLLSVAVMVFRLFSFMGNRQAADFYYSVPLKRGQIYMANVLAVVTWIAVMTGTYVGSRFVVDMFLPGLRDGPIDFMAEAFLSNVSGWCLKVLGTCLLVLGGCCLGVVVAGSTAGGGALTAVILTLSVLLRLTLSEKLGQLMGSIPLERSTWLSQYGISYLDTTAGISMFMLSGLCSGCIGIVCCAAGYLLYCSGEREKALRGGQKKI